MSRVAESDRPVDRERIRQPAWNAEARLNAAERRDAIADDRDVAAIARDQAAE